MSEFSHLHYSANHPFIPVTDDSFLTPALNLPNSSCLSCFPSPWCFSLELCLETHDASASFCRTFFFFPLSHPGYAQKGFFCKPNGSYRVTYSLSLKNKPKIYLSLPSVTKQLSFFFFHGSFLQLKTQYLPCGQAVPFLFSFPGPEAPNKLSSPLACYLHLLTSCRIRQCLPAFRRLVKQILFIYFKDC